MCIRDSRHTNHHQRYTKHHHCYTKHRHRYTKHHHCYTKHRHRYTKHQHRYTSPRGLTFSWWGCYGLCQTACPFKKKFCSRVCFCLCSPFNCNSFYKFSRQLSAFSLSSSGLISALLLLSTIDLFSKVSLSPDLILCGWLGLKHQLTITLNITTMTLNSSYHKKSLVIVQQVQVAGFR